MRLKRASIVTKAVVFALALYAAASLISLRVKIDNAYEEQRRLKEEVFQKEAENDELEHKLEYKDDDNVIADIARDNFGLVMPGEKVFYDKGSS